MTAALWFDAALPRVVRASRANVAGALVLGLTVAAGGCASGGKHPNSDEDIHPIAIEIDNNLTVPTELMIYLEEGGVRRQLGSVPGAKNKTFQFTPNSYSDQYRLIGRAQLEGFIRSQQFTIGGSEMGTVVWNLQANILGFYDVLDATTPQAEPAPPAKADTAATPPATPPTTPPATPPPPSPQFSR